MQTRPDAGLGPVPQPAPRRHPGAADGFRRDVAPCDTSPQHVQDASEGHPVGNTQSPGMAATALGSTRQQRSHPLPQVVRNKISTRPDTLPTVAANGKTRSSTLSRKVSGGELAGRESDQLSGGGTQAWCRRIMCVAAREGVSRIAVFRRATASGWESCWPIRPACRAARATAWLRGRRSAS